LPTTRLAKHLRSRGVPAVASRSAGSYLCNFIYYLSLDWARRQQNHHDVCFVHVPPRTLLSEPELMRGSELILGYLLTHARDAGGMKPASSPAVAQALAARTE
jgi:pyroglutamyl-peptidase